MDNTEKLATYGTQVEDKQNIDMQRYFFEYLRIITALKSYTEH
jgi:hypothetical protein